MTDKLVPFGKYRGKPVEALAQDREYCEWLASQDWFKTKFAAIHTLIVNNFGEPSETPEHNALQARFLNDDWLERFFVARTTTDRLNVIVRRLYQKVLTRYQTTLAEATKFLNEHRNDDPVARWEERDKSNVTSYEYACKYQTTRDRSWYADPDLARKVMLGWREDKTQTIEQWQANRVKYIAALERAVATLTTYIAQLTHLKATPRCTMSDFDREFEERGADVEVSVDIQCEVYTFPDFHLSGYDLHERGMHALWECVTYRLECKPTLGDDYPAVLRQMRASKTDTLVIGEYVGVGATLAQVEEVFGAIHILTVDAIDATDPLSPLLEVDA